VKGALKNVSGCNLGISGRNEFTCGYGFFVLFFFLLDQEKETKRNQDVADAPRLLPFF